MNIKALAELRKLISSHDQYLSKCRGFDSHIPFHALLEDPTLCSLVAPASTAAIGVFQFTTTPVSDSCKGITIPCLLEEVCLCLFPLRDFLTRLLVFGRILAL